jgi:hypothetical protein
MTDDWDEYHLVFSDIQKDYELAENDDLIVFIYGYPFNPKTGKWISGKDVCLLFSLNDLNFIHDIDGIFTIMIIDIINKTMQIITDRYGIYNLFYYQDDIQFIVSDKIYEIMSHLDNVKLNVQSIMEYLYFGFKLGNKTHIDGVKEFEGSTIVRVDSDLNMKKDVYWNLIGKNEKHKISKENFRIAFNDHIKAAFALEKEITIPLSGGLDTRTILSSSIYQNLNFECFTYGKENAPDVKIAKKICNHLNIKHTFFEIDEEMIKDIPLAFKKGAWNYNGLIPPYSSLSLKSFEDYSKDKLILLGSLGNEIWRGLLADKNMEYMTRDMIVSIIMNLFSRNKQKLLEVYNGYSNKEILDRLKRSLENEMFSSSGSENPIDQFETFVLKNWGSNWAGAAYKGSGKYFKIFSTYLNKDILPQIVLQNRNERMNGSIQKYIISKNNPYLAGVRLDTADIRHGASVNNNIVSKFKDMQAIIPHYSKAAVNYIPKRILRKTIFKTPYFTDYPNWLSDYNMNFIQDVLEHDKMITKNLFKRDKLYEIIQLFFKGDDSLEQIVTRLIGLELWLSECSRNSKIRILQQIPSNNGPMMEYHETEKVCRVGDE